MCYQHCRQQEGTLPGERANVHPVRSPISELNHTGLGREKIHLTAARRLGFKPTTFGLLVRRSTT